MKKQVEVIEDQVASFNVQLKDLCQISKQTKSDTTNETLLSCNTGNINNNNNNSNSNNNNDDDNYTYSNNKNNTNNSNSNNSYSSNNRSSFPNLEPQEISAICSELQLRQQKQRNLMVFGLKETEKDDDVIKCLMKDVGVEVEVETHYRVGKAKNYPRPLVLRFATEHNRFAVESNLCNLKGKENWYRVSIVPDLTKLQCLEEKQKFRALQEEVQKKNEENVEGGYYKIVGRRGSKHCIHVS